MGALFDKLGINIPTLIAQVINFGILMGLLYLVAYKPVLRMLDQRAQRVKQSMDETDRIRQEAANAEEAYKKRIELASREGQEIVSRAAKTGEEVRVKAEQQAKQEAELLIQRARGEISRERDEAIGELRREFADLTILAAEKVIDKSLDKKAHEQLIEKALEESTSLKKG